MNTHKVGWSTVSGYAFCGNACKPPVTVDEVERYQHRFRIK